MGFNTIKMEVGLRDHGREVNQMGLELQFTLIKNSILGNLNKVFCMDSADHSFTTVTSIGDTFIKEDCKDQDCIFTKNHNNGPFAISKITILAKNLKEAILQYIKNSHLILDTQKRSFRIRLIRMNQHRIQSSQRVRYRFQQREKENPSMVKIQKAFRRLEFLLIKRRWLTYLQRRL